MYVYEKRDQVSQVKIEKLTLRLEGELIDRAKRTAEERGTSVSKMVAGFFESIEDPQVAEEDLKPSEPGEVTRRLRGSIGSIKSIEHTEEQDEQDYRRYLERKYG